MPPAPKDRLDKLLVVRGLCDTRSQAQGLIMRGDVKVNGEVVTKPGTLVAEDVTDIELTERLPYVSRGGLKLEKALDAFGLDVSGKICLDIGASTGGFTDCLLQRGASKVYAVDVGYGQLDWKLRQDARVVVMEKTNIRHVDTLPDAPDIAVCDASFISLKKVLPVASQLLKPDAAIIALLKPQFEHKDYLSDPSFKGVVRRAEQHQTIVHGVLADLAKLLPGWQLCNLDFSPITGPKGNIEFLLDYRRGVCAVNHGELALTDALITETITKSYTYHSAID